MKTNMNRNQHLQWCKDRSKEYLLRGETKEAIASFLSDMSHHTETANHAALGMMASMMMGGLLNSTSEVSKFIDGFN